jgi:uncharacterized membrane protein YebE (DUF533 family)
MANINDLIGAFLQNAAAPSGQNRMGNVLESLQKAGLGGTGAPVGAGGAAGGLLGGVLDAMQKGLAGAARNPAQAGGMGAILGGLLGGGGDSVKGALGGGALAMLASVAMKALMGAGQTPQGGAGSGWSGGSMPLGLKTPETPAEEQALASTAELVLKGMINAAKADGQIDQQEGQRITGKLQQAGIDQNGQQWVMSEMYRPLDLDAFVAEIHSPEVAAQVYAASLLAIEVDTDAERDYLQQLARRTGLQPAVVQHIHQTMDVPV